jgi:hypothetical protein
MNALHMGLATRSIVACCAAAMLAAPALAAPDVAWTIDPLALPPPLRQQALNGPLGDRDPFGNPAQPGCIWTRIQVPTTQGLRWLDEENCDNKGTWR